jgi:hypothetical protein
LHDASASGVRPCVSRRPAPHVKPYANFKRYLRGDRRSLANGIAQQLTPKIAELARALSGEPKASNRSTWRFGRRGSLALRRPRSNSESLATGYPIPTYPHGSKN